MVKIHLVQLQDQQWTGVAAAAGAILFFGTYAVPVRHPSAAKIDPVVFQVYKSFVCFATSWLVLFFQRLRFTWWGIVAGSTWVINGALAIKAVQLAGIGSTQSIWSGLSIFVSFFWGTYVFHEHIQSESISYASLLLMAAGMVGIALATAQDHNWNSVLGANHSLLHASSSEEQTLLPVVNSNEGASLSTHNFLYGLLLAVFCGLLNGSLMVPLKYANQSVQGIEYLISFGTGGMLSSLTLLLLYQIVRFFGGAPLAALHLGRAATPALLAGLLWSSGNFCSLLTTIHLGLAIGWPLVQCQIIVSALWAVLYFKEAPGFRPAAALLLSTCLLLAGAALLFHFGTVG